MAEAKHFNTEVRGNGFPFCITNIDVSDQDADIYDWITLGGWSKDDGDPTPEKPEASKRLSFQNAVRLFWNLNGLTGIDDETDFRDTSTIDLDGGDYSSVFKAETNLLEGDAGFTKVEPKYRVCGSFGAQNYGSVGFDDEFINPVYSSWYISSVLAMYDGPVDDEDNFVGYGIEADSIGCAGYGTFPLLGMGSYVLNDEFNEFGDDKTFNNFGNARAVGYVEQDGIHFMGDYALEFGEVDTISITSSEDGVVGRFNTVDGQGQELLYIELIIKDFDFYTYPT